MSVDSYSVFQSAKFFKRHRIKDAGLRMEQKPFSIGVRMEHPQALIDAAQYGEENAGKLPPADYRINHRASNGRGVYSDFTPPRCSMGEFLDEKEAASGRAAKVLASLPDFAAEAIKEAVPVFAGKIHGYDDPDAVITAVETRSSSPVRIMRSGSGESNISGIRAARHVIEKYRPCDD